MNKITAVWFLRYGQGGMENSVEEEWRQWNEMEREEIKEEKEKGGEGGKVGGEERGGRGNEAGAALGSWRVRSDG